MPPTRWHQQRLGHGDGVGRVSPGSGSWDPGPGTDGLVSVPSTGCLAQVGGSPLCTTELGFTTSPRGGQESQECPGGSLPFSESVPHLEKKGLLDDLSDDSRSTGSPQWVGYCGYYFITEKRLKLWPQGSDNLSSYPNSTTFQLCDLGQVTLCALFSICKWTNDARDIRGCCED